MPVRSGWPRREMGMSDIHAPRRATRREMLQAAIAVAAAAGTALPAGRAAAQAMTDIPREKTMTLIGINSRDGRWVDFELWNPYAVGSNHQNGPNMIYEPL